MSSNQFPAVQRHQCRNFYDILTYLWRSCKVWINVFFDTLQNSLLTCWILLHLLLQYRSSFWKTPGGGILTFNFIVSILFDDFDFGFCSPLIASTVSGRGFIIASVSVISVCRDSSPSFAHAAETLPYLVLQNATHMDGCWWIPFPNNQVPSMVLKEIFYLVVVHFTKCFWQFLLWTNKIRAMSDPICLTLPLQTINLLSA